MTVHQAIASPGCDGRDMLHSLISIDEARARIAAHAAPVGRTEAVSTGSALGRILSLPVTGDELRRTGVARAAVVSTRRRSRRPSVWSRPGSMGGPTC